MKPPTVSSCCCCIDIRTGGIILGILGVVYPIVSFICGEHWLYHVWTFIIEVLWLVGIFQEKPNLMLPSIFLSLIFLIVLLLSPLFLPFLLAVISKESYQELRESDSYWLYYFLICVFFYFVAAIGIYILTVLYSVYKLIDDKVTSRSNQAKNYAASLPNYEA